MYQCYNNANCYKPCYNPCCKPCSTSCGGSLHCKECPEYPTSLDCGMLTAEGNGKDVWGISNPTINIPFGQTVQSAGCVIAHGTDTSEFVIMETGEYQIEYQLSARHDGVAPGLPIDLYADLVSNQQGNLDMIHFTDQNQLVRKKILTNLNAGDVIHLQGRQTIVGEMQFNQQMISISKVCE